MVIRAFNRFERWLLLGAVGCVGTSVLMATAEAAPSAKPASENVVCLSGDPDRLEIESQIAGWSKRLKDDDFLVAWRVLTRGSNSTNLPFAQAPLQEKLKICIDSAAQVSQGVRSLAHRIVGWEMQEMVIETLVAKNEKVQPKDTKPEVKQAKSQRRIARACIEAAVSRREIPDVSNIVCDSDKTGRTEVKSPPCLTSNYVDYVYYTVNEALECLGGGGREIDVIDAQLAFKKFNLESGFRGFVQSERGIGLAQLTSIAAKEMSEPHDGYRFLKTLMERNPQKCAKFEELADTPIRLTNKGEYVTHCQFVSMGSGMPRNLLKGIGLYLYFRDGKPNSISEMLSDAKLAKHRDFAKMRDYLTLVSFSSEGPRGSELIFEKIKRKISMSTTFEKFKKLVDDQTFYTRAMDSQMVQLFGDENKNCLESP